MKLQIGLHSFSQAISCVAIVISIATIGRQIESLTDATVHVAIAVSECEILSQMRDDFERINKP